MAPRVNTGQGGRLLALLFEAKKQAETIRNKTQKRKKKKTGTKTRKYENTEKERSKRMDNFIVFRSLTDCSPKTTVSRPLKQSKAHLHSILFDRNLAPLRHEKKSLCLFNATRMSRAFIYRRHPPPPEQNAEISH